MEESIMADPQIANEAWIDTVRVAEARGIPVKTRPAQNRHDHAMAAQQQHALSRRSFGMPEGYDRIFRRNQ
jgi:hypothetical protein